MVVARSDFYPEFFWPGLRTLFFNILDTTPLGDYPMITTVIDSDKDHEKFAMYGTIPGLNEFKDERQVMGFGDKWTYEIWHKKYELTLGVRRDELEDEQYGIIKLRIQDMASEIRRSYDEKVFKQLQDGALATSLGWDGKPFFANDHDFSGSNQDNLCADAFAQAALITDINTMRRYTDDKGRLIGINPDTLYSSPELAWTIMKELNATSYVVTQQMAAGGPLLAANYNSLQGAGLQLKTTPYFTSVTEWYLMDTKRAIKPVILAQRTPVEFTSLDNPSDRDAFMRDMYLFGARVRFGLGYGNWMTCLRGNA